MAVELIDTREATTPATDSNGLLTIPVPLLEAPAVDPRQVRQLMRAIAEDPCFSLPPECWDCVVRALAETHHLEDEPLVPAGYKISPHSGDIVMTALQSLNHNPTGHYIFKPFLLCIADAYLKDGVLTFEEAEQLRSSNGLSSFTPCPEMSNFALDRCLECMEDVHLAKKQTFLKQMMVSQDLVF